MLLKYWTRQMSSDPVEVMRQLPKPREMIATEPTGQRALEDLMILRRHREQRQVEHVRGCTRTSRRDLGAKLVQQRGRIHRARRDVHRRDADARAGTCRFDHDLGQRPDFDPVGDQATVTVELDDAPQPGEHTFLDAQPPCCH